MFQCDFLPLRPPLVPSPENPLRGRREETLTPAPPPVFPHCVRRERGESSTDFPLPPELGEGVGGSGPEGWQAENPPLWRRKSRLENGLCKGHGVSLSSLTKAACRSG